MPGRCFSKWFLVLFMALPFGVHAQSRIYGVVTSGGDKQPVAGVMISLMGTSLGTQSDVNGKYELKNIKPGDYTLQFTSLGFAKLVQTNVVVKKDEQKELNVELQVSSVTFEQDVVIRGKRPLVDVEKNQTSTVIGQDNIELQPVRQIQKIINTQPGVINSPIGINIRGGRTYETGFLIDGVSATDPLGGTGFGLDLGSNSMKEVEITTGGIGADVGDATAGVVNATTRSGGDKFELFLMHKRDNFGNYKKWNSVFNQQTFELNMGGGIGKKGQKRKKFHFYTALRANFTDEYYRNPAKQIVSSLYPNTQWTPYQDNRWSGMLKLNYDFSPKTKLTFTYMRSLTVNQDINMLRVTGNDVQFTPGYQYAFQQQMDNANTFTHDSYLGVLNFTHTPSKRFVIKATLSRLFVHLRADANGRPWRPESVTGELDPRSFVNFPVTYFNPNDTLAFVNPPSGFYNNNGIATLWHDHFVEEYVARFNGTLYSRNTNNKLYFGTEMKFQEMRWIDITRPWIGAPIQLADGSYTQSFRLGDASDVWHVKPNRGAFFVTDKIKYKGLIADVGLRFEYWSPGKFIDDAIKNPDAPITQEVRDQYMKTTVPFLGRRYKLRLLPKIAASFPITENQVLYFNYGHTTILPHPSYIYAGMDPYYADRSTLSKLGNPDLNPEVDISYELGLRSQLTSNDAITISAYVKDKYDFVTSATIYLKDASGREVARTIRINSDYARIRGLELGYIKRIGTWFTGQFSASYMVATGQSASANESLKELLATGAREDTKEFNLPWGRPFDVKFNTTFKLDNKMGWFNGKLNHVSCYLEGTLRSGQRYTPYVYSGNEPNTGRPIWVVNANPDARYSKVGSPWFMLDFNARKWWKLNKKSSVAFTLEITNLLNHLNTSIVNPVTGTAYKKGDAVPTEWQDPRYMDPRDPRSYGLSPYNPARYLEQRHYLVGVSFNL